MLQLLNSLLGFTFLCYFVEVSIIHRGSQTINLCVFSPFDVLIVIIMFLPGPCCSSYP
jgi:hypothetical protein